MSRLEVRWCGSSLVAPSGSSWSGAILRPNESAACSDVLCCIAELRIVMDLVVWLRSQGLGKYEVAFRENEIDETVLLNPKPE